MSVSVSVSVSVSEIEIERVAPRKMALLMPLKTNIS
jgi:hypothetical protein